MQDWDAPYSQMGCTLRENVPVGERIGLVMQILEGWWILCRTQEQAASAPMTLAKAAARGHPQGQRLSN